MKLWDEMSPRERDALVAEKVMGWEHESGESIYRYWHHPDGYQAELPRFSQDIESAFEVVEKMQSKDWGFILDNMHHYLGNWLAHFEKDDFSVTADHQSASEAICKAALKACGVSI